MSLSDCVKCWDNPCICGWEYRHYTKGMLKNKILMLNEILKYKTEHPGAVFSGMMGSSPETEDDEALMKILKREMGYDEL